MFKFYKTNKYGETVRVESGALVNSGDILNIEGVAVKLGRKLATFDDGNSVWKYEKIKRQDETSSIPAGLAPILERIAVALEQLAEHFCLTPVEDEESSASELVSADIDISMYHMHDADNGEPFLCKQQPCNIREPYLLNAEQQRILRKHLAEEAD